MYKFANKEGDRVNNLETGHRGIHKGVWLWKEYQEWLAEGNITEAYKTEEELQADSLKETERLLREERKRSIEDQKEEGGFKDATFAEAQAYISDKLNNANDDNQLKDAIADILLRLIVPFILTVPEDDDDGQMSNKK